MATSTRIVATSAATVSALRDGLPGGFCKGILSARRERRAFAPGHLRGKASCEDDPSLQKRIRSCYCCYRLP
jgi:hypothetical protein